MVVGAGERMQQASWCYRCAEAVRWCSVGAAWERMQQASWCYRGAGGSVLVAVGAACQRWLSGCWWLCAGGYGCSLPAVAVGAAWNGCSRPAVGCFFVFCCFLFCFLLVFPRFRKLIAIKINIPTYNTAFYIIFYIFLGILKLR